MNEFEQIDIGSPLENLALEKLPKLDGPDLNSITPEENEPQRSINAFRDYVRLGKGRSLERLARQYTAEQNNEWTNNFDSVFQMLKRYSTKYHWQERLRNVITQASAEILATAQKDALLHAKHRIRLARDAQNMGMLIIEKAELENLTPQEARKLLKQGATLLQLGLTSERAEAGDSIATIKPDKPIRDMTDDELDTYADTLLKAIN